MGRPPIPAAERRADRVTLRMTETEMAALVRVAKKWGISTGAALRRCLELATKGET